MFWILKSFNYLCIEHLKTNQNEKHSRYVCIDFIVSYHYYLQFICICRNDVIPKRN